MKTCLTLLVAAISVSVFAQGRLSFNNDSLHLVYLNPDPAMLAPADAGLAGKAVPAGGLLPSGESLVVDLFAGTSSSSMSLMATTTFGLSSAPGEWSSSDVALLYPGGTPLYFQVVVQSIEGSGYYGSSVVFSGAPGTVLPPAKLTDYWPVGTYPLPDWGPGAKGAIMLSDVPEPSAFALLLLAGAVLVRKSTKR